MEAIYGHPCCSGVRLSKNRILFLICRVIKNKNKNTSALMFGELK
jgi:hypothetical protein